jgi:hypothetical protein
MVSNSYNHSNPTEIKKTIFTARTNKKNTEVTKFINPSCILPGIIFGFLAFIITL